MAGSCGLRIAVCGGGVIGSSVTYFLTEQGVPPTLIDRCHELCTASAKAGGFLALDWCDSNEVGALARASFKLHEKLANTLKTDYGYRRLSTLSATVREQSETASSSRGSSRTSASLPSWLDLPGRTSTIGTEDTTAQCHPARLTQALRQASIQQGAKLVTGTVVGLAFDTDGGEASVSGVHLEDGTMVEANVVVLALGPWSHLAADWLSGLSPHPLPQLSSLCGMKAHSIVLQAEDEGAISPHAVFMQYTAADGEHFEPEIYPRPNGEVYVCGLSEVPAAPPADPSQVKPTEGATEKLRRVAAQVSPQLAKATLAREQACILPISPDNLPLIGQVPGVQGLYIATGHSCWGILNAPATGAALADVILQRDSSLVDLSPFDPARFVKRSVRKTARARK